MARITFDNLKKSYGGVEVVKGVDLTIEDGEFLVLVGPSGCGKTTTLRMLAGLEAISGGTISIGDRVVNTVEPKDRNIGMVFQNYALYPHMSVRENMSFGLRLHRVAKPEIDRRISETAELLGLTPVLSRKPRDLSGGQRQRVALGRAIVREPAVFLMDEPLSNLDAKLRVQTRGEILRLHRRLKSTFVYVTHDQVEAMTMADRIVVMKDGAVQQVATPSEMYERPANAFVAGFMGTPQMNLLDVEISSVDGAPVARHGSAVISLRGAARIGTVSGASESHLPALQPGRVTLGIRPEDITLSHTDAAPTATNTPPAATPTYTADSVLTATMSARESSTAVAVRVDVVETLGAEQHVTVLMPDETPLTVRVDGRAGYRTDDRLYARFAPERLHFFDAVSGARI